MRLECFLKLCRPKQWIKNFFVFAPIMFSKQIFNYKYLFIVTLSFLSFCLISSCVYIINDIVDVEKDRKHPVKKHRPIAAGNVTEKEAKTLLSILLPITFYLSFLISVNFFIIVLVYFINNLLYSFKIKNIVIIDVMSIAFGFLLRVCGGAISINVSTSAWLLLCTILISLFLGFNKRRNELLVLKDNAENHREILEYYSVEFIDSILSVVTPSTVIAYSLYTFTEYNNKTMMITIPFVLYGIFRYQYIVHKMNKGGSPEEAILRDKPILITIFLWAISSGAIIYK